MPHKDYVKASRPKPGNRAKKATRTPVKAKPHRPWILLFASALLIAGFIWFLWFLNQQPAAPVTPVTDKTAQPRPKQDELPAKPTEEPYQYIKELENKEVKVDVAEQQQSGPFQMQCGSFRQQQQAETLKAQIAFAGFSSEIRKTEGSAGIWYRVVLGPYESRRQALADRNRLRQHNINGCQIWNWT